MVPRYHSKKRLVFILLLEVHMISVQKGKRLSPLATEDTFEGTFPV